MNICIVFLVWTQTLHPQIWIPGFLRLDEVGNVLLDTVPFTFHLHSYGQSPPDLILQLPLASTGGMNLPIALNSHTRFLAGLKLSGTATVIASVPFSSVTRVFPPLCLRCSFSLPYLILHWYAKDRMTNSKVEVCIKKGVKDWNQANAHWIFYCFN